MKTQAIIIADGTVNVGERVWFYSHIYREVIWGEVKEGHITPYYVQPISDGYKTTFPFREGNKRVFLQRALAEQNAQFRKDRPLADIAETIQSICPVE